MSSVTSGKPPHVMGAARTNVSSHLLHDLRSQLNQIIGFAEMIAEEGGTIGTESLAGDVDRIRGAGRRMLGLLEENFTAVIEHTIDDTRRTTNDDDDEEAAETIVNRQADVAPGLILIVDDDATNRDVLSRRLTKQGHHAVAATNGPDALQLMLESAFDLVLLDIMMPDMDGYEVLGHIKSDARLQHIPVIMISALSEVQSVVRCIEAGAEDYLAKPFNPTLLRARIGASLEKKRGRDRETALYEQLQQNYKRLQEVEKLRDDMRNMIVHDLRTPLTGVIMGLEMLGMHGGVDESQDELTAIALRGSRTLLSMINDLLDVEKMEAGLLQLQYGQLTAESLVKAAVEQVATLASEGETVLVTEIDPALRAFAGDESKLCRTLVNLIANAVKFTRHGTVTIGAAEDDARNIRFTIRDTGSGIPADAFERIFEKFGQLDARKAGSGLGLAFCKLAVEAHGGRIAVASTVGAGSTFFFTIPVEAIAVR